MIIKFVALAALTATGVGTVIALNPPEVKQEHANRSNVSVPEDAPTNPVPATAGKMSPLPHDLRGPRGHERPRYMPPPLGEPGVPNLNGDGREFEDDWSEHEGWHGEWDDDAHRPQPRDSRHSQQEDDNEEEDGR